MAHLIHGSFRIVSGLTTQPPDVSKYQWAHPEFKLSEANKSPLNFSRYQWDWSSDDPENGKYSPFQGELNGAAIFRINETLEGAAKFRPVYLIPTEWAEFAAPAWKYQQANAKLFDELSGAKSDELRQLLTDANPFLAVRAATILAKAGKLNPDLVQGSLAHASYYQQAAFICLLMTYAAPNQQAALIENLSEFIDATPQVDSLKGIALAMKMSFENSRSSAMRDECAEVLKMIAKKQSGLGSHTPANTYTYIDVVLILSGVRKRD